MSKRVEPGVAQVGYLHFINKKLKEILDLLSGLKPDGKSYRIDVECSKETYYIDVVKTTGSPAIGVIIKNNGPTDIYVGINRPDPDLKINANKERELNFGWKVIRVISLRLAYTLIPSEEKSHVEVYLIW